MDDGCAEPTERVCDEIELSGECEGGAIFNLVLQGRSWLISSVRAKSLEIQKFSAVSVCAPLARRLKWGTAATFTPHDCDT
jgi:hypothetical protein